MEGGFNFKPKKRFTKTRRESKPPNEPRKPPDTDEEEKKMTRREKKLHDKIYRALQEQEHEQRMTRKIDRRERTGGELMWDVGEVCLMTLAGVCWLLFFPRTFWFSLVLLTVILGITSNTLHGGQIEINKS